jgi:hypothetical protein
MEIVHLLEADGNLPVAELKPKLGRDARHHLFVIIGIDFEEPALARGSAAKVAGKQNAKRGVRPGPFHFLGLLSYVDFDRGKTTGARHCPMNVSYWASLGNAQIT